LRDEVQKERGEESILINKGRRFKWLEFVNCCEAISRESELKDGIRGRMSSKFVFVWRWPLK